MVESKTWARGYDIGHVYLKPYEFGQTSDEYRIYVEVDIAEF